MVGFLRENLEKDCEFRSEDLQEEINEWEARDRHDIKSTNASSAKLGNPNLAYSSRLRPWLCCCRDSKVVYFK